MNIAAVNRISILAPFGMSLLALIIVVVGVAAGWAKGMQDEGAAAHSFQILIVAQIPFMLAFLATADWKRYTQVARILGLQIGAVALAFGPVAYFRL